MVDRESLKKIFTESPSTWFGVDELSQILAFEGKPSEISNELGNLWIQHFNTGDFAWQALDATPLVIMRPDPDANRYKYVPALSFTDWTSIVNARLAKATAATLASDRAYWVGEAEQALQALKAHREG